MAALLALVVAGSQPGRLYRPTPLALTDAELARHGQYVVVFGNSRIDASINPKLLASQLDVGCQTYIGGGWHTLHYEQLALLNAPRLRPGKDVVLFDASILSAQRGDPDRINVIRPETATAIASLPGLPFEKRLDILFGAVNPVYRYRIQIQTKLQSKLEPLAARLSERLPHGLAPQEPPYRLVTDPAANWVMLRIDGDRQAFLDKARQDVLTWLPTLEAGDPQQTALARGVEALRGAGIDVLLIEPPVSSWLRARMPPRAVDDYRRWLDALAARTGARVLRDWPEEFYEDDRYYDAYHLFSRSTDQVTRHVATALRDRFPTIFPAHP